MMRHTQKVLNNLLRSKVSCSSMIRIHSSPPTRSESCLLFSVSCVSLVELNDRRGWARIQSYDHEKVWPSINHSILSVPTRSFAAVLFRGPSPQLPSAIMVSSVLCCSPWILVRIQIRGIPLTIGSGSRFGCGSRSCYLRRWPSRRQQQIF